MKKYILFIPLLALSSCNAWKHSSSFQYEELMVADYEQKMTNTSDAIIVDVRTNKEYTKSHIQNAINISYFGGDIKKYIDTLDKNKPVFIYCQTQHRSPLTAKIMKKKGFKQVIDLKGGFMKWEKENKPMVK
ncbi:MAG: rhodanese-like domain-containing protein [Bacteroidia bacterium]|nr:rhodanese-like domain-containing protein [Bacteroidia bacterium]